MRRYLPVLLVLFVGSGCAALIYEVVWFQLLQLVIGSSAISLGVLLGVYMGGMCLGSLYLPKLAPARLLHPLKLYAAIEAGIGICGLLVLFGVPRLNGVYAAIASTLVLSNLAGISLRALVCVICLLPPTFLMGASLPAVARLFRTGSASSNVVSWLGFFYGGNIAGAVIGSLLAGFYLLRLYNMAIASYAAVAVNLAVAGVAFALAAVVEPPAEAVDRQANPLYPPADARGHEVSTTAPLAAGNTNHHSRLQVYIVIAISGMCALGAEVVWTRLLSLMLGATVYTFSIILAVFLAGLGIGSNASSALAKRLQNSRIALGVCQLQLAVATAWAAYSISVLVPSANFDPTLYPNPMDVFRIDLMRCIWTIFPAAFLWGASFPLALDALAEEGAEPTSESGSQERDSRALDSSELVGRTYAANTLGAIIGVLAFSMILIPRWGTARAEMWLIVLPSIAGGIALVRRSSLLKCGAIAVLVTIATALLVRTVKPVPWLAIGYGRRMNEYTQFNSKPLYIGEGMNSSIVVSEYPSGVRYFHVSGKVEATTEPFDMRLERMLGHISALFTRKPESVLVVGFGAGVTAGTFVLHPSIQRIVISEIEPLIPPASTKYFKPQNYDVLHDPRTEMHYDDARHFILTTKEKFDVITSDPIHPWVKGTSTLYSKEYFELCKQHLKPGGVVTQWVPLYESDFDTIKSEFATFFEVFPHGTVWNSDASGSGYDVVLVGQAETAPIDIDGIKAKLARPDHARVVASLTEVGLGSAEALLATYAGREDEMKPWLYGAQINRDMNMRLQYLAGWGLNFNHADMIYHSFLEYRWYPEGLFTGSAGTMEMMKGQFGER